MSVPLLLTWLLATVLPLGALWLLFRVVLRTECCFGYNRALLLLAPVLAALLPRFRPDQQAGQPVAVSFTVPVLFKPAASK